jgi:transposase
MAWRRGRSYSEDLRARVLAAIDSGIAARAAASVFRVSVSYIYKALIRRRRTGEVSASTRRGHRPRKLTPAQEAALAVHITAYRDVAQTVLTVDTQSLVAAHRGRVWLSPMNSGSTIQNPLPRGIDTFKRIEEFPFWERATTRRPAANVVELLVEESVPDIEDHVLAVHRCRNDRILGTIWQSPNAVTTDRPSVSCDLTAHGKTRRGTCPPDQISNVARYTDLAYQNYAGVPRKAFEPLSRG